MKNIKLVYEEPQSPEVSDNVGAWPEGQLANLSIYEVDGGGFVFTFDNCHENHDMYAKGEYEPFATQQEAFETATWLKDDESHVHGSWLEDYNIIE